MSQRIGHIYKLVTIPSAYRALQSLLGADRARRRYIAEVLKPKAGMRFLDVGCGPATLVPYLSDVDYTGIDLNPKHIEFAIANYGNRGRFMVGDASQALRIDGAGFDLVNISALLHHLDDRSVRGLLRQCTEQLRPGGCIVTFDNVWLDRQNPVAKLLIGLDSGLNVRTPEGYLALAQNLPVSVETRLFTDLLRVPYDHFCMIMTRIDGASTDGREARHAGPV